MTAGIADMLSLAKAFHVPAAQAASLFESFNPGVTIPSRTKRMVEASFSEPAWALTMARKDARLMLDAAVAAGVELAALPGIAARMDAEIAAGHGAEDWTVIARDAVT
jgi:3-hydroxyisobutyrate dehydrogenase